MALRPVYDKNGMIVRYDNATENEHGMTTGVQQAQFGANGISYNNQPTGNYYLNNQRVTEDVYRKATAPGAGPVSNYVNSPNYQASTQTPQAISNAGVGAEYLAQRDLATKREAEADALKAKITDRTNPYAVGSDSYNRIRSAMTSGAVGDFSQQRAMAESRIGGAPAMRQSASDAASRALRSAYGQIEGQLIDKAASFETDRDRALMTLGAGDYSGAAGLYAGLMNSTLGQYNTDRDYGLRSAELPGILAARDAATQGQRISNENAQVNVDILRQTLPSIIAKMQAGATLTEEEARQLKFANDNAWVLAGLGFASNIVGPAIGAIAGG